MISQISKRILKLFLGKVRFQRIFEFLHFVSLAGMNIGANIDLIESGEIFVLNKYFARTKGKKVFFDVGANVGDYSQNILKIVKPEEISLFAFEPSKDTYNILKSNLAENNNVTLVNKGLGATKEIRSFYNTSSTSGCGSIYNRKLDHFNAEMIKEENIDIITLDEFCEINKISHIDFLKIDVEGHEFAVLEGAKKMLNNEAIDYIQFEFGGTMIDSRIFFQDFYYLLKDKYDLFRILKDGLSEIVSYSENREIFLLTNYLAIKKGIYKS